jgi:hypothetical protein
MKWRIINLFFVSVATLLIVAGTAKLYSATGTAKVLSRTDPILGVNNRALMVALGVLEIGIAGYLLARRDRASDCQRAIAVLWLSGNFIAYRVAMDLAGATVCPCLGTLTSKLPLTHEFINQLLGAIVLYWFLGSALILWLAHAPGDSDSRRTPLADLGAT